MATKIEEEFEKNKKEAKEINDFIVPTISKMEDTVKKIKSLYYDNEYKKMFILLTKDYSEIYEKAVKQYEFVNSKYGACREYMDRIEDIENSLIKFFNEISKDVYEEENKSNKYLLLTLVKMGFDVPELIHKNNSSKQEKERKQKEYEKQEKKEHLKSLFIYVFPLWIIINLVIIIIFSSIPFIVFILMPLTADMMFFNFKYTKMIINKIHTHDE